VGPDNNDIQREKVESALRIRKQGGKSKPSATTSSKPASSKSSASSSSASSSSASSSSPFEISARVIEQQKRRQKEWTDSTSKRLQDEYEYEKKKSEDNSNRALKVVILVWVLIIVGIFYHVYNTIQLGSKPSVLAGHHTPPRPQHHTSK